jgi:uncharacterized membrane protein YccC
MAKLIGIIAGLVVFWLWMNIVGNPHVVETLIGVVLGLVVGIWVWKQARNFSRRTRQI